MGGHEDREDPLAGWPGGRHSSITPRGEAEQADKFLAGLSRQQGWRKVAARVAAAAALIIILGGIVVGVVRLIT